DVEGEYTEMDSPSNEERLFGKLRQQFGMEPAGLPDFRVSYPASCTSTRPDALPFTLRLAEFETGVIAELLQTTLPERNSVLDVSVANDTVKNLVTADLLRKTFAYKLAREQTPPTLLVIEEAHSFISRERAHTMQATLNMLRSVTRRGRKRWLSVAFVSQQP